MNNQLLALKKAIKNSESREIHRIIHSIKGGAMNIRAENLLKKALVLENMSKKRDFRNISRFFKEIKQEVILLIEDIGNLKNLKDGGR